MQNDPDEDLKALFARSAIGLSDEAFVVRTMQQVRAAQVRATLSRRVLQGLGIAILAAVSPFLMRGATLVSGELESALASANRLLETPTGTAIAIICSIVLVWLDRRRASRR